MLGPHSRFEGPRTAGRTAIGRATVQVLAMNVPKKDRWTVSHGITAQARRSFSQIDGFNRD